MILSQEQSEVIDIILKIGRNEISGIGRFLLGDQPSRFFEMQVKYFLVGFLANLGIIVLGER